MILAARCARDRRLRCSDVKRRRPVTIGSSSPNTFPAEASSHDFSQRRLHAVRLEAALRGRDDHVFLRSALRPHRPQRRRQIHVHEAADGRPAGPAWIDRRSAEVGRSAPGPVRLRPIPRHRHGDHGQPAAVERAGGARRALRPPGHVQRGRHAPRRARRASSARKTATPPRATPRFCSRASTSRTRCTER